MLGWTGFPPGNYLQRWAQPGSPIPLSYTGGVVFKDHKDDSCEKNLQNLTVGRSQWLTSVISALWEAKAGGSPEVSS